MNSAARSDFISRRTVEIVESLRSDLLVLAADEIDIDATDPGVVLDMAATPYLLALVTIYHAHPENFGRHDFPEMASEVIRVLAKVTSDLFSPKEST